MIQELVERNTQIRNKANRIRFKLNIYSFGTSEILILALRHLLSEMAKNDKLVTFRKSGEIKIIMRGEDVYRLLMEIENTMYDPSGFDMIHGSLEGYAAHLGKAAEKKNNDPGFREQKLKLGKDGKPEKNENGHYQLDPVLKEAILKANATTLCEEIFGVHWVGFKPFKTFNYDFRWAYYGQKRTSNEEEPGAVGVWPRKEKVNSLYGNYQNYGIEMTGVETGSRRVIRAGVSNEPTVHKVRVKIQIRFSTRTTNAKKTLFRASGGSSAGDWYQAIAALITHEIRLWVGSVDWETLVEGGKLTKEGATAVEQALNEIMNKINGLDKNGLTSNKEEVPISTVRDFGQEITSITMPKIDQESNALQVADEQVYIAERGATADEARARGNEALAAAQILGEAQGLEKISTLDGGKEMYIAKHIGNIRVYAPGRDGLLFNISESVTGNGSPQLAKPTTSTKKEASPPQAGEPPKPSPGKPMGKKPRWRNKP